MTPAAPVKVKALACPNCGAQIDLRGFANTLTAVCPHCTTVLDTGSSPFSILHQFQENQRRNPSVPLGSRGKFDGAIFEVIGFQARQIVVDGTPYEWSEYVLFNPYKGFRYLSEYNGHWNFIWPVRKLPFQQARFGRKPSQVLSGRVFRHFQNANAATVFVLGEFPWRVKVEERVEVDDYTAPPYVLSAEHDGKEINWSEGRYMEGREVWQSLGLKDGAPAARGVYLNQPSTYPAKVKSAARMFLLFGAVWLVLLLYFAMAARREIVLDLNRQFVPRAGGESVYVTPEFDLKGHTSNIEVSTTTDLDNQWTFFGYSLINTETGQAWDFGREVGYYHGTDSDGSWTEGGKNDAIIVPSVPPGHYFLRVEPESDTTTPAVNYRIVIKRDVPVYSYFLIAGLLLLLPLIVIGWRSHKFEYARWQESDYATSTS
jgi:hypothetical protein